MDRLARTMFELTVRRTFSAAHAIVMRGARERLHGHDWRVAVTVSGEGLDPDGLLCDFHALESTVGDAVAPFHNRNLNETQPFDRVNPTAENVAEFLAMEIARRLPHGISLRRVEIEEAPGCVAAFLAPIESERLAIEMKPIAAAQLPGVRPSSDDTRGEGDAAETQPRATTSARSRRP